MAKPSFPFHMTECFAEHVTEIFLLDEITDVLDILSVGKGCDGYNILMYDTVR